MFKDCSERETLFRQFSMVILFSKQLISAFTDTPSRDNKETYGTSKGYRGLIFVGKGLKMTSFTRALNDENNSNHISQELSFERLEKEGFILKKFFFS